MQHRALTVTMVAVLGLFAAGALFAQDKAPAAAVEAPKVEAPAAAAVPAAAEATPAAPAEPAAATEDKKPEVKPELITMTVSDAKIQDVLRSLAAMRPSSNILMGAEVQGNVSFALKDVSWEMALQLVTESNGFTVTRESDNVYRVHKPEAKTAQTIVIELMTKSDIVALSTEDVFKLAGVTSNDKKTPEQARLEMIQAPGRYIKMLAVDNRPAVEVVNALARKGGLNYAFSADLGQGAAPAAAAAGAPPPPPPGAGIPVSSLPPISLNLKNISVVEAMKLVSAQGALSCVESGGVWVVKPMPAQQAQQEPLVLETFVVKYLPMDDDLLKMCQKLLSSRGSVNAGKNKVLVVRDTADGIAAITTVLKVMDKPTPQVTIEARFFELTKDSTSNIGVDWTSIAGGVKIDANRALPTSTIRSESTGQVITTAGPTSGGLLTNTNGVTQTALSQTLGGVTSDITTRSFDSARSAILDASQFNLVLAALQTDVNVKSLSNPKIVVASDQQATIHIGDQKPIVKATTTASNSSNLTTYELDGDYGGETTEEESLVQGKPGSSKTKFKTNKGYLDTGTKLTVSPSVKTEDQIYIQVVPELVTWKSDKLFGNQGQSFPLFSVTQVRTQFTIKSGQTIAIGGLVTHATTKTETKVPVLGSIPWLGAFFRNELSTDKEIENVIFLTVKIVPGETLQQTSGIPVRAHFIQSELAQIKAEDAAGAEYNEKLATEVLQKIELEKKKKNFWTKEYWQKEQKPAAAVFSPAAEPAAPAPAAVDPAAAPGAEAATAPASAADAAAAAAPATDAAK